VGLDLLCFVVLTILVWGVNALQRGLWQDDVQALGLAFVRWHRGFFHLFGPDSSPLRRFTALPSFVALMTPYPIQTLQILAATMWLAVALLIGWIVGLLLPDERLTRFIVICLTITATSDYQTASVVPLAYNFAAVCVLAAIGFGLRRNAIASAILLAISLWTMDVAFPAIPFVIAFFICMRWWRVVIAWIVVLVPTSIVEWRFLNDPASYAARARVPMAVGVFVQRTAQQWILNFTPWRWAFSRVEWYPRPAREISFAWMVTGSIIAVIVFLLRLAAAGRRRPTEQREQPRQRSLAFAFSFLAMAAVANAAYAGIHFAELHYRTHILARVWASAAIGILASYAIARRGAMRVIGYAVATLFVFFGTWGGIERQDLFLGTWRQHQRELASIVNAAPALRAGTGIILRSGPTPDRYLATEADYLTSFWMKMLYDDAELVSIRLAPDRGTTCTATPSVIDCAGESSRRKRFAYEHLIVMDYDNDSGTYHVAPSLGDPRYQPANVIIRRPLTTRQRRLLLLPE